MTKQILLFPIVLILFANHSVSQVEFVNTWVDSISTDTWDIALADVDNDSDLDVLIANEGVQNLSSVLLLNDGSGNFYLGQQLYESAKAATFGDLDNDEDMDFCLINSAYELKFWVNDGTGSFILSNHIIATHSGIEDVRVGLLNNDLFLDIVVLNLEHPDEIFFNNGDLTFVKSSQELGLSGIDGAGGIELGDMNGDGFTDIFKGNWGIPCAQVWINDGSGYFTELVQDFGNKSEHIHGVALSDFNNDNDLDVFIGYSAENVGSEVWLNDGSGIFILNQEIFLNSSNFIQDICTADFDKDGDSDVFVASLAGNNALLINDGTGVFTESEFLFPDIESLASAAGDLNGDTNIDLFVTSNTWFDCLGYNSVWLNISSVNVQEIKLGELAILPNPANEHIFIHLIEDQANEVEINISDLYGQLILSGIYKPSPHTRKFKIGIQDFHSGIYILNAKCQKSIYSGKLIVRQ